MPKSDAFTEKFRELLKEIPAEYTLKQWQHAYRQAIFLMGMQILERFEEEAIAQTGRPGGPRDRARAGGDPEALPAERPGLPVVVVIDSHGGGPGGGGNPTFFRSPCCNLFPDYPLALQELTESALRSER
jgi:hypothetical protein